MNRPVPNIYCKQLFINNEWRKSSSGQVYNVEDPSIDSVICQVQEGSLEDVDLAVEAARKALAPNSCWKTMDASSRGRLLHKLTDLMEKDSEYLALLESLNNGRVIESSRRDMKLIIQIGRYFSGLADKLHGETIPADGGTLCMTTMEPIGVCGLIFSWNFPLLMLLGKIGPALACGNTVVIKPAKQTPLTTLYLAKLVSEAGFPPGVVNVVTGSGSLIGKALSEHMEVDMISFTGSTTVGQMVMEAAARSNCKRTLLALSGKSPVAVFPDADLDKAVFWCHRANFTHQGQICCAGSRVYVHEDIYEDFIERSKTLIQDIVIGDPLNEETTQGPQIDHRSVNHILEMIRSGIEEGAKLECGGKRFGDKGCFVEPTLFSGVEDEMIFAQEEIFGPVQQVFKFKTLEEVIERSNNTRFGLVAAVFSSDINTSLTYARNVKAGTVWVNTYFKIKPQTPYGGFKMSGFGKEMGFDSAYDYLQSKTIAISISKKKS